MAFLRETFNIKRGVEHSTSIVVGEKRQLLMSPHLALGGAIDAWTTNKGSGCGISYVRCEWSDYLL